MMHKRYVILLLMLALAAPAAQADTIHLKNGSVLKGKVASFSDDQFIVMLDTGSGRYLSRAMVYVGDVARIEFEGAPAGAADGAMREAPPSRPTEPPAARDTTTEPREAPRETTRQTVLPELPRNNPQTERQPDSSEAQPAEKPAETKPTKPFDRASDADKPAANPPAEPPPAEPERPTSRKNAGPVRSATIDVIGKRDWTSTGLIVKRGDRIRINASGAVTLDPASGRMTGPEGTTDITDGKKLMADQPTGALIGVIGADNDDFIFIGKSSEFTATRDGLLFLSVNEGNLGDNVGAFKALIEVQSQKR